MPKWTDASSYSSGDTVRTPRAFSMDLGEGDRIDLHHYINCGDTWFVSCFRVGIERVQLSAIKVEDAKTEAIGVVNKRACALVAKLARVLGK